jgi:hypothetical protein
MAHEPLLRYPSAAEFGADLEEFLAGLPGNEGVDRPLEALPARRTARAWDSLASAETSIPWVLSTLSRLSHPDAGAWKVPIAAE